MLFNSYEFIFLFFPLSVLGYFACARFCSLETTLGFLVLGSLFFYAFWEPAYLILLLTSIGFNFLVGRMMSAKARWVRQSLLVLGLAANLGLWGSFKYAGVFFDKTYTALGLQWDVGGIFLPLAISFFTFQQIAYLVDVYRCEAREDNFLHYSLFVCFFPQLLAGPIVRYQEIMPQFTCGKDMAPRWSNFAVGLSIFAIGLFKKTVLADSLGGYVGPVFDTRYPPDVDFFQAWGSALAYTFQLYFDFSGYADMALGASRVFGVRLPVNFFSPYKSTSVIEFWHRWHITLSRFMRDYLYIVLGGNRKGKVRRYVNLFVTMLLGGLWHGAGLPFMVWGGLHGGFLVINHAWRHALGLMGLDLARHGLYRGTCWLLTFIAVVFSWVYFRAPTLEHGNQIALAMLGFSDFEIPAGILARAGGVGDYLTAMGLVPVLGGGSLLVTNFAWIACSFLVVLVLPNVAQVFSRYEPVLYDRDIAFENRGTAAVMTWDFREHWALAIAILGVAGILTLQHVSEFIYLQF